MAVENNMTTIFVGNHYEVNATTGEVTKYYYAGATRIAMQKQTVPQNPQVTYLLGDHLGSTSIVTDDAGTLLVETRYKPWGEVRYSTPDATLPTRYSYTGQYSHMSDEATDLGNVGFGLMFYNARWYDPSLGRFAQADTIVPASQGTQGLDRYTYVNNSPVNFIDPSGHGVDCGIGEVCRFEKNDSGDEDSDGNDGCTKTGYCLPVMSDYYGERYTKLPTAPYGVYIKSNPDMHTFLISNPEDFSDYLMTRTDHTKTSFTLAISYGLAGIIGTLEEGAINYFGERIASNTFQEIGRYVDQAGVDGSMDVSVSVIPKGYYMGGPYTNLDNKPLFYDGGLTVVLIQGVGSNQVRPIIIQDVYYPELMYTLGNQP